MTAAAGLDRAGAAGCGRTELGKAGLTATVETWVLLKKPTVFRHRASTSAKPRSRAAAAAPTRLPIARCALTAIARLAAFRRSAPAAPCRAGSSTVVAFGRISSPPVRTPQNPVSPAAFRLAGAVPITYPIAILRNLGRAALAAVLSDMVAGATEAATILAPARATTMLCREGPR